MPGSFLDWTILAPVFQCPLLYSWLRTTQRQLFPHCPCRFQSQCTPHRSALLLRHWYWTLPKWQSSTSLLRLAPHRAGVAAMVTEKMSTFGEKGGWGYTWKGDSPNYSHKHITYCIAISSWSWYWEGSLCSSDLICIDTAWPLFLDPSIGSSPNKLVNVTIESQREIGG